MGIKLRGVEVPYSLGAKPAGRFERVADPRDAEPFEAVVEPHLYGLLRAHARWRSDAMRRALAGGLNGAIDGFASVLVEPFALALAHLRRRNFRELGIAPIPHKVRDLLVSRRVAEGGLILGPETRLISVAAVIAILPVFAALATAQESPRKLSLSLF